MTKQVIVARLDSLLYGIDVKIIQEVIYNTNKRTLPEAPNFMEGLGYVRNQLIPIVRTKRLFESPFFDFYHNKKMLILNFGNNKQVGISIDEVLGVESFDEEELKPVPTLYTKVVKPYILGYFVKKNQEIIWIDIEKFFFTSNGLFRYRQFINRQELVEREVSENDFILIKTKLEEIAFPFNKVTINPIERFLIRLCTLSNMSIVEMLEKTPHLFKNLPHSQLRHQKQVLFENKSDMLMISEYLDTLFHNKLDEYNVLVIDNGEGLDAISILLMIENFPNRPNNYKIYSFSESGNNDFLNHGLSAESIFKIPKELYSKFFDEKTDENHHKIYSLKKELQKKLIFKKINNDFLYNLDLKFNIIYAPNFLIKNMETIKKNTFFLENLIKKNGILILGLFEDIEEFVSTLKKYYIKNRLIFIKD